MVNTQFKKKVDVNTRNLRQALLESVRPMTFFFDPRHDFLPFFGNTMVGESIGNSHHSSFSMSHIPGRWLNALLNIEDTLGIEVDKQAIEYLRNWTYQSLECSELGFPACIDTATMEAIPETDLHNLREVMHALTALVKYRGDQHAYRLALDLIKHVDMWYDYEQGRFLEGEWSRKTGGKLQKWCGTTRFDSPFPISFGRYIGTLVKFYRATGESSALQQALKLKEVCFRDVLDQNGDYDVEVFGGHTHSTTAMLSSLCQLGQLVQDHEIFERVHRFMKNGLSEIALDFGWCIEGYFRTDCVGEINNTADIMEVCLALGQAGYPGYFAQAERILRAHFLPAQLLDTSFIQEGIDPSHPETYCLASKSKGAFGFPCPYGHEDHPGADISFNWDIVGGGAGGLCEAVRTQCTTSGRLTSINLLFDYEDENFSFLNPYDHDDTAILQINNTAMRFRIRIPTNCADIHLTGAKYFCVGEWIYLYSVAAMGRVTIAFAFKTIDSVYTFRENGFVFRWHGEEVTHSNNDGKRLCFFESLPTEK